MLRHAALIALVALAAAPALAAPGGRLGVLPKGQWRCALPGDAAGAARVPQADADFAVRNASSYSHAGARGTYLLLGDRMTITAGPLRGAAYRRVSTNTLRRLDNAGGETALLCVRAGANSA